MTHNIWNYKVISAAVTNPEGYAYHGYGIAVRAGGREVRVEDVFTSPGQAEAAAGLLNRHQVSPRHLKDVLEDMLI